MSWELQNHEACDTLATWGVMQDPGDPQMVQVWMRWGCKVVPQFVSVQLVYTISLGLIKGL